jgi:hypothetical protein
MDGMPADVCREDRTQRARIGDSRSGSGSSSDDEPEEEGDGGAPGAVFLDANEAAHLMQRINELRRRHQDPAPGQEGPGGGEAGPDADAVEMEMELGQEAMDAAQVEQDEQGMEAGVQGLQLDAEAVLALVLGEAAVLRRRGAVRRASFRGWQQEQAGARAAAVLRFLQRVCEASDVLRRIVCHVALEPGPGAGPEAGRGAGVGGVARMDGILGWGSRTGLPAALCELILVMLPDPAFKAALVRIYGHHYKALNMGMVDSAAPHDVAARLIHISVQLYSSSVAAHPAVVEDGLLDNMLAALEVCRSDVPQFYPRLV